MLTGDGNEKPAAVEVPTEAESSPEIETPSPAAAAAAAVAPWLSEDARASGLYMWDWSAQWTYYRLGNQLFFYAVLFGYAWRDGGRHFPLWPDTKPAYIHDAFQHLSIPVDMNNSIVKVFIGLRGRSSRCSIGRTA